MTAPEPDSLSPGGLPSVMIETLAEAAHMVFARAMQAEGYRHGPVTDPVGRTHAALKPYSELLEDEKEQNRGTVRDIPAKLASAGYRMLPVDGTIVPFVFPADQLERLSEMEHARWVRSRIAAGWRYAERTEKSGKLHHSLVPWRRSSPAELLRDYSAAELTALGPGELSEEEREKDRVMVRGIPHILAAAGFIVVGAAR